MTGLRRTAIAGLAALAVLGATAGVAAAKAGDASLAAVQTRANAEIDRRVATLTRLTAVVADAHHLTDADRTALNQELSSTVAGLNNLKAKIAADTDAATARTDARLIVTDYRVYVLVQPKVHIDRAADALLDAVDRFTTLETKLQAGIDKAKAAGDDVTAMQQSMDDLKAKVTAAHDAVDGVPADVLPLTPAQWPGAHDTLKSARQSVVTARTDLRTARADAQSIVTALKALKSK